MSLRTENKIFKPEYRCRICLEATNEKIAINQTIDYKKAEISLKELLEFCVNAQVCKNGKADGLCLACMEKGIVCYEFKKKFEESQSISLKEIEEGNSFVINIEPDLKEEDLVEMTENDVLKEETFDDDELVVATENGVLQEDISEEEVLPENDELLKEDILSEKAQIAENIKCQKGNKQDSFNTPGDKPTAISLKGIEDDISWTEKFIELIRTRPAIYNKSLPEHSNRLSIQKYWTEIGKQVIVEWETLDQKEKLEKEKIMKNRWRNLTTCFRRELQKQKGKSGQGNVKRRKYIHFDDLLFLLPCMEERPTRDEDTCSVSSHEAEIDIDPSPLAGAENILGLGDAQKENTTTSGRRKKRTYEDRLIRILETKADEEVDEDKSFLLSLLPAFKKMNSSQKLEAKMDFLATIKRITIPPFENYDNQFRYPSHYNQNSYQAGRYFPQTQHWQGPIRTENTSSEHSGSVTPIGACSADM